MQERRVPRVHWLAHAPAHGARLDLATRTSRALCSARLRAALAPARRSAARAHLPARRTRQRRSRARAAPSGRSGRRAGRARSSSHAAWATPCRTCCTRTSGRGR
eukprot:3668977-Pleurochrysis_carterae.AAC.1